MTFNETSLVESVRQTIRKYRMIDTNDTILVAVSGGADSVCLLHVLHSLGFRIGIAHLNHGWRGEESDADECFVKELAAQLDLPFFTKRSSENRPGNREAEARTERKRFLDEIMTKESFTKVALGHSLNDRNETLLLNLLRGTGLEGLISMKAVMGHVIRPLIQSTRQEIEEHLTTMDQEWRNDRTNTDLSFARNRLRHVVLPTLISDFNSNLTETLGRTTEILEDENDFMLQEIDKWIIGHCHREKKGVLLQIEDLTDRPVAFVRRVLRESLIRAGSNLTDIGFDHVERVRSLLKQEKSGKTIELPGKISVERNFDTLVFCENTGLAEEYDYNLTIPGRVTVSEIGYAIEARLARLGDAKPKSPRVLVDGESLGPCVRIRNWRNGDFYSPVGLPAGKLKKLFQDERIPRRKRHQLPVLVSESSIIWVASFPVSREFAVTRHSQRIIEFEALPLITNES